MKLVLIEPSNSRSKTTFYIGTAEVTQAEWGKVMANNPSAAVARNHPVEKVSWTEAVEFCERLSALEKRRYRLPTEREWGCACRVGLPSGILSEATTRQYAWCLGEKGHGTRAVKTKRANALGIYDMLGNVAEWCANKVIRGGSFLHPPPGCQPDSRFPEHEGVKSNDVGFRVVLEVPR